MPSAPEPVAPNLQLRRPRVGDTPAAPDSEARRRRRVTMLSIAFVAALAAGVTLARGPLGTGGALEELTASDETAPAPLSHPSLVLRYTSSNPGAFAQAQSLATTLDKGGYSVTAIEPGAAGGSGPTVRYFVPGDRQCSLALASRVQATLQRPVTTVLVPPDPGAPPEGPRAIEVWLAS